MTTAAPCPRCGGQGGHHGLVHKRHAEGGGGTNTPCPNTPADAQRGALVDEHRPTETAIAPGLPEARRHRLTHTTEAIRAGGVAWGWTCSCEAQSGLHLHSQYAAQRDWFLHTLHVDVAQLRRELEAQA